VVGLARLDWHLQPRTCLLAQRYRFQHQAGRQRASHGAIDICRERVFVLRTSPTRLRSKRVFYSTPKARATDGFANVSNRLQLGKALIISRIEYRSDGREVRTI